MTPTTTEIVQDFIKNYESNPKGIHLYHLYTDFKRSTTNTQKSKKLSPLYKTPFKTQKEDLVDVMIDDHTYIFEKYNYTNNKLIFQMTIKAWNCSNTYAQFNIIQVLFGEQKSHYLLKDIDDTEFTSIVYNLKPRYVNTIKLYKHNIQDLV